MWHRIIRNLLAGHWLSLIGPRSLKLICIYNDSPALATHWSLKLICIHNVCHALATHWGLKSICVYNISPALATHWGLKLLCIHNTSLALATLNLARFFNQLSVLPGMYMKTNAFKILRQRWNQDYRRNESRQDYG